MNEAQLPHQPQDYTVVYVDMNAFFASVEQQEHAELRARPVAVAACMADSCCIVAASYEARAYGVGVGWRVGQARQRCPALVVVRDSPALYRHYHEAIMAILQDTYCRVGVKSIDEAYLMVPSYARNRLDVSALIEVITSRLQATLGEYIKCSIGIGPNIWLAKMAAERNKPNGRTFVELSTLTSFYAGVPLVHCTGIGRRLARRLYSLGVSDAADLASRPLATMRSYLGVMGEKWYLRMRGYEVDLDAPRRRKSISHQVTVVGKRGLDALERRRYVAALAHRLSARLRGYGLQARGIGLFASLVGHKGVDVHALSHSLTGDTEVAQAALGLLERLDLEGREIRLFALYLDGLEATYQLSLPLGNGLSTTRDQSLSRAIDSIHRQFGPKSLLWAAALKEELVPERIGFGRL